MSVESSTTAAAARSTHSPRPWPRAPPRPKPTCGCGGSLNSPLTARSTRTRGRPDADATISIAQASVEDLARADAFAFGTPTRLGTPAAQLNQFIDQTVGLWQEGKLADNPVIAFTSAYNRHGGSEATILSLGNVFYWGALIVSPGYADPTYAAAGNPYHASFVTGASNGDGPDVLTLDARHQGRRLAQITTRLLGTATPPNSPPAPATPVEPHLKQPPKRLNGA